MSEKQNFVRERRRFLAALGGLGMGGLTLSLSAATRRETALDRFEAVGNNMCISPSSIPVLNFNPEKLPKDLTIVRSRLLKIGFIDEIARSYEQKTRNKIRLLRGDCDDGVIETRLGKAHLGDLCCPIPGSPANGMQWLQVAQDIKVVLVPTQNPITNISLADLRRVATGEIRNWKDLGGPDRLIALIVHNHCPPYLEPVRTTLLSENKSWSKYALHSSIDALHVDNLTRFETSIGVNSWVLAKPFVERGLLKVLSVDNVLPSVLGGSYGEYPLTGPFNLVFAQWMEPMMRPFFDFLYGTEGQHIISKNAMTVTRTQASVLSGAQEYFSRSA